MTSARISRILGDASSTIIENCSSVMPSSIKSLAFLRNKDSGERKKGVRNRFLTFGLKFSVLVGYGKSKACGSWWFDLSCA
jgi:hypothetical protein